jgi:uncharacterized membrane protein YbhN (UPF0104 family)
MHLPNKYLHDRLILLLLTINSFFTVLGSALILLRLGSSSGVIWSSYRSNLGISPYTPGKTIDILGFILFLLVIFAMNTFLSVKVYQHHRNYAVAVLGLGTLLTFMTIIISNALLVLR